MQTQKYYNKSARDFSKLAIGSPVMLKDIQAQKTKWYQGWIVEQLSDRSYLVSNENTGNAVRRNIVDLRPMVSGPDHTIEAEVINPPEPQANASVPPDVETAPISCDQSVATDEAMSAPWQRARQVKLPSKYKDYEMY